MLGDRRCSSRRAPEFASDGLLCLVPPAVSRRFGARRAQRVVPRLPALLWLGSGLAAGLTEAAGIPLRKTCRRRSWGILAARFNEAAGIPPRKTREVVEAVARGRGASMRRWVLPVDDLLWSSLTLNGAVGDSSRV